MTPYLFFQGLVLAGLIVSGILVVTFRTAGGGHRLGAFSLLLALGSTCSRRPTWPSPKPALARA